YDSTNVMGNFTKRIAATFPAISYLHLTFPSISVYMEADRFDLVKRWREALKALPALMVLQFEGGGLFSVMHDRSSPRPEWKAFFEDIGEGRTLIVGDEFEEEGVQPVVDEFSLELLDVFAEAG
ncbi:hypothetical protein HDU93_002044, partial [Gonapodya sp. JEL0774]